MGNPTLNRGAGGGEGAGGKGNRQTKASTYESNKCADVFISYPLSVA